MMQGFHPFRTNDTVFQKPSRSTTSTEWSIGKYPLGHIQSQGRTHGVMAQTVVPWIPLWASTPGWREASIGWRCPRTCHATRIGSPSEATAGLSSHYRPNNLVAHGLFGA